jgi:hypothetical protein
MAKRARPIFIACLAWAILCAGCASTAPAQSLETDWKLYGAASIGGETLCFYDDKGMSRSPGGHIRVWTKCISKAALDDALEKPLDKKLVEGIADKLLRGYVPPILKLLAAEADDAIVYAMYEMIADLDNIRPQSRIFYELKYRDRMLRELSIDVNINGRIGSKNTPSEWKYVAPEGNGAALLKLLCT